jgi:hypothetical protein
MNETHYRSRKCKWLFLRQLCLRDCAFHSRSRVEAGGEILAILVCLLVCYTPLASSNFRSEKASMVRAARLGVVAVENLPPWRAHQLPHPWHTTLPSFVRVNRMGHPAMPRDSPSATRGVARAQQAAPLRTALTDRRSPSFVRVNKLRPTNQFHSRRVASLLEVGKQRPYERRGRASGFSWSLSHCMGFWLM